MKEKIKSREQLLNEISQLETKISELEKSKLENKIWLENSPVCTKILDLDFNLQYMSQSGIRKLKINDVTEYYGKPYPFSYFPDAIKSPMVKSLLRARETRETIQLEAPIPDVKGNIFWFQATIVPVENEKGQLDHIMVVSVDVTYQKHVEKKIVKTKQFYENIIEGVQDGIWVTDKNDIIFFANKGMENIAGIPREQIQGKHVLNDFPEETVGELIAYYNQAKEEKKPIWYDIKVKTPAERYTWQNGWLIPKYEDEDFLGIICTIRDVNEHKQSEEALKESETKYRSLVETASDAIYLMSEDGTIIDTNQAAADMLGMSKDEIIGSIIADIDPNYPIDDFLKFWRNIPFNEQYTIETTHLRKDRTLVPIEICGKKYKLNGKVLYYGIARDISKRKQSEEQFKQQSLDLIFLNSMAISLADKPDDSGFSKTLLKGVQNHTKALAAVFSLYDSDEKTLITKYFEAEKSVVQKIVKFAGEKILNISSPVNDETYALITKSPIDIFDNFVDITFGAIPSLVDKAMRAATGIGHIYAIGHFIDGQLYGTSSLSFNKDQAKPSIEMLKSYAHLMAVSIKNSGAAKAMNESETRFKALHNASFGGIAIHDKGLILDCNQGLSEISGYPLNELIGMDGLLLIAEESREMVLANIQAEYEKAYEAVGIKKNGEKYPVRLEARMIPYKEKMVRVVEFRDITERKLAENKLKESEILLNEVGNIAKIGGWEMDMTKDGETTWTKTAYDIIGVQPGESIPDVNEHMSWYLPEYQELVKRKMQKLFDSKQPMRFEAEFISKKGDRKWCLVIGEAVEENGSLVKFRGTLQDTTERKQTDEEIYRLKKAVDDSFFGVVMATLEGTNFYSNNAAYKLFGYDPLQDNMDGSRSGIGWSKPKQFASAMKILKSKGLWKGDMIAKRKNGSLFDCYISANVIKNKDGEPWYIIAYYLDITDRKQAEESVKKLNEELERKVIKRTKKLETSNKELSRMNKLFVGRELRMVELKQMIKKLEGRLTNK